MADKQNARWTILVAQLRSSERVLILQRFPTFRCFMRRRWPCFPARLPTVGGHPFLSYAPGRVPRFPMPRASTVASKTRAALLEMIIWVMSEKMRWGNFAPDDRCFDETHRKTKDVFLHTVHRFF